MNTQALGPTFAGGMQPIIADGYELIYYPDVNNNYLQAEGKSPVFYYLPNELRIARKNDQDEGDLMFTLIRFAGVQTSDTNVGLEQGETREVAGGVLGFSVTSAPPDHVLEESQQKLTEMFQGKTDFFWGIRSNRPPIFRPVPIVSNETMVSNLSPGAEGTVPTAGDADSAASNGTGNPPGGDDGGPRIARLLANQPGDRAPESVRSSVRVVPNQSRSLRSVVNDDRFIDNFSQRSVHFNQLRAVKSRGNIDPWFWKMQGQGSGPVDPMGKDAYTALLGAYPTAILWESFRGAYSPMFVDHILQVKFWTPQIELTIRGNWDRVYQHFSAHAKGRYLWFSGDIKAELNSMRQKGDIEVDLKIDATIPNGEEIVKKIEERTDFILQKFMEQAKTVIFDPPQPDVAAAQTSGGGGLFGLWGGGLALKYRRDSTSLDLYYHEKRQIAYLQEVPVSGSLEGVYDEIRNDPDAERKYFQTVYLDDWPRKLGRLIKPVVNWNSHPVAFASVQIGYPNTQGDLNWAGRTFQEADPDTTTWNFTMTQKFQDDVDNPPADWGSDVTFIKRKIHMREPDSAFEDNFVRVQIEDNEIELDPGQNGSPMNDVTVEVRADDAGKILVGPLDINVELENARQVVEVTFQATDENGRNLEKFAPVKFSWTNEDQTSPRYWSVFSSDDSVRSYYKYRVRVIVKGSLFTKGMEWTGPWTPGLGNGPLMVSVPTPEDDGVTITRSYQGAAAQPSSPPSTGPSGPPPTPSPSPSQGTSEGAPPSRSQPKPAEADELILEGFTYEASEEQGGSRSSSKTRGSSAAPPTEDQRGSNLPPPPEDLDSDEFFG